MSIPEVVQTSASYLTTLLGLVENTVRCGACYILWFNTPIKKKNSPVLRPFWVAHAPSSVNCKETIPLPVFPKAKGFSCLDRTFHKLPRLGCFHGHKEVCEYLYRGEKACFSFFVRYTWFAYPVIGLLTRMPCNHGGLWNMHTRSVKQQTLRGSSCDYFPGNEEANGEDVTMGYSAMECNQNLI